MIDVLSKLRGIEKQLLQENRRPPTPTEIADRAQMDVDEVRRVMDIGRHPVSLDRPVGEGEDCSFGEFIEDSGSDNPVRQASNGILRDRIDSLLKTLTFREREIIRLRYGLGDGYTYTLEEVGRIFKVTRERVDKSKPKPSATPESSSQQYPLGIPARGLRELERVSLCSSVLTLVLPEKSCASLALGMGDSH